jgi:hypothetical protein
MRLAKSDPIQVVRLLEHRQVTTYSIFSREVAV